MIVWSTLYFLWFLIKESNSLWCFQCSEFGVIGKDCPRSNAKINEWKLNPIKFTENSVSVDKSCVFGYDKSNLGFFQVISELFNFKVTLCEQIYKNF